jgi:hypothetical protein
MPLLLRNVRENRWLKSVAVPWLAIGDVPADPLGDLATKENRLSVWEVIDRSNVERIVRALAVNRDKIADMGYVLFDSSLLTAAGINTLTENGMTPDEEANNWHRDLIDLSGNKLVILTKLILEHGESGTVLKKRLEQLVADGIEQKQLPEKCRSKISKPAAPAARADEPAPPIL